MIQPMHGVYRDGLEAAIQRRDELYAEAARGLEPNLDLLGTLYERRVARAVAGAVVIAALALVVAWALLGLMRGLTVRFLWAAALGVPAYLCVRLAARWRFRAAFRNALVTSHDPFADIERMRARTAPLEAARTMVEELEARSYGYPMAAVALVAPLLLHFLFYLGFMRNHQYADYREFDGWIVISALIVGHAHFYLVVKTAAFARDLSLYASDHVRGEAARRGNGAWAGTVGVSALPGVVLLGIPPMLVAVTGALIIPALFRLAGRAAVRERAIIGRDPLGAPVS